MDILLDSLTKPSLVEKLLVVVLRWISKYDIDFDGSETVRAGVDHIIATLAKHSSSEVLEHVHNLQSLVQSRTKSRTILLKRGSVQDALGFSFRGGKDFGCGIFVSHVDCDTQAEQEGLRVGDEIISVSGRGFHDIAHKEAEVLIKRQTNVSMEVRYNPSGLRASIRRRQVVDLPPAVTVGSVDGDLEDVGSRRRTTSKGIRGLFSPFKKGSVSQDPLHALQVEFDPAIHSVLRVYRDGDAYKHMAVTADTTADEVVGFLTAQFNLEKEHHLLCLVTVEKSGVVKQAALPPGLTNLGDKSIPCSRLYLKSTQKIESLLTADSKLELSTMFNHRYFEGADARVLAREMTLRSFTLFENIEPLEYVLP